jgi:hypothetical protein
MYLQPVCVVGWHAAATAAAAAAAVLLSAGSLRLLCCLHYLCCQARLIIDDEVLIDSVVAHSSTASVVLQQGWHDVELHSLECAGAASVRLALSVDGGVSMALFCYSSSIF